MRQCLLAARAAGDIAAGAGLASVPETVAASIGADYDSRGRRVRPVPGGPATRLRGTGGWLNWQRDTYNLAKRLRDEREQILRLLDDTRVPSSPTDPGYHPDQHPRDPHEGGEQLPEAKGQ